MATPGPKMTKKYDLEFKLKAVRLSEQPDVLIKDVAASLCIHPFMLSRWRKEVRDGVLSGEPPPVDTESVAELKRLRQVERQFKQLEQEHDLLKKPFGLFPNKSGCLPLRRSKPSSALGQSDVPAFQSVALGLLCQPGPSAQRFCSA